MGEWTVVWVQVASFQGFTQSYWKVNNKHTTLYNIDILVFGPEKNSVHCVNVSKKIFDL